MGTRSLMLVLVLLRATGSAFNIIEPFESQTVVARADSPGLVMRVDLGEDLRVPEHGILAIHLDSTRILLACPARVQSGSECPSEGSTISGEFSLKVGSMLSGEHVLTAELLDVTMAPLAIARRVFTYMEESEEDDKLTEDAPAYNMIVFSKDRACQLDQLLSSLRSHVRNFDTRFLKVQVLYHHSNKKFADGYKAVKQLHPTVTFHQQGNLSEIVTSSLYAAFTAGGGEPKSFKGDYLRLIDEAIPYTMHFMDDMLMTDTWSLSEQLLTHRLLSSRPEVLAMSLRLHPLITKTYTTQEETPVPDFDSEMTWLWREARGDWAYPMSLDAHIFRTHEISRLIFNLDYHNPNTLEGALAVYCYSERECADANPRLACFKRAKVINIPANRVQDSFPNRYMLDGPSPELLNTEFLFNRRLKSEHHWYRAYESVHVPQPLVFGVGTLQHEMSELGVGSDSRKEEEL